MPSHTHNASEKTIESDSYNEYYFTTSRSFASDSMGRQKVAKYDETLDKDKDFYRVVAAKPSASDYVSLDDISQELQTAHTGGGLSHNNMPPYLTVYIWKRIQ